MFQSRLIMESDAVLCFFNSTFHQYKKQLGKCRKSLKSKDVHDFRVAYKKLAALKSFLDMLPLKTPSLKVEEWMDKNSEVYKKVGKHRNLQVIHKFFDQLSLNEVFPDLEKRLLEKTNRRKVETLRALRSFRIPSSIPFKQWIGEPQVESHMPFSSLIGEFVRINVNESMIRLRGEPGEEWHEARRFIKNSYLILQAFSSFEPGNHPEMLPVCSFFEHELGKWHDLNMVKDFLSIAFSQNPHSSIRFVDHAILQQQSFLEENLYRLESIA